MNMLRSDTARISTSMEEVAAANRASGMQRAVMRMKGFFFEYTEEITQPANVTDIETAAAPSGGQGHEAPDTEAAGEGQVIDMDKHRRIKAARENVAAAEPATVQDFVESQAD